MKVKSLLSAATAAFISSALAAPAFADNSDNLPILGYMREHVSLFTVIFTAAVLLCIAAIYVSVVLYRRLRHEKRKTANVFSLTDDYVFEYNRKKDKIMIFMPAKDGKPEKPIRIANRENVNKIFMTAIDENQHTVEFNDLCFDGKSHWLRALIAPPKANGKVVIGTLNVIDKEIEEKDSIEHKLNCDSLTGLYNVNATRRYVKEELKKLKDDEHGAFINVDLDHLKRLNSLYGHNHGDKCLIAFADFLRRFFSEDCIIGRFGGDEFVVYIKRVADIDALSKRCAELGRAINLRDSTDTIDFTISIGASLSSVGDSYEALYSSSDFSLYKAKIRGRNRYCVSEDNTELPINPKMLKTKYEPLEFTSYAEQEYLTILHYFNLITIEYDLDSGDETITPFISEYIAGNYDGRLASEVMMQDSVIYKEDVRLSHDFRSKVLSESFGDLELRLLTPIGDYHWFRLRVRPFLKDSRRLLIAIFSDIDEDVNHNIDLQYRLDFDPLTHIYNAQKFYDMTERLFKKNPDTDYFLMRFDIDRFKLINELYNFTEGDKVLQYVGSVLCELAHEGEAYARMGNDVFCFCARRSKEDVINLVNEIETRINEYPIEFDFIVSVGIVGAKGSDVRPINILCDCAALAQRQIKGNYVQRYMFFDESMSEKITNEHKLIVQMSNAIEAGQFLMYLQPKVNAETGKIIGSEALVRWKNGDGLMPPNDFIPLFEHNNFVLRLDEYIWEQACIFLRGQIDDGKEPLPVSVNVSRKHMHDDQICDKLSALVKKYDISPRLLELEITESAYVEYQQGLYEMMDKLQRQGFVFLMDDFGSGYSSLNVLKDISVDKVKIDLKFLQQSRLGKNRSDSALRGVVRMVRDMGIGIIVEGAETKEQIDFLHSLGCNEIQGYYYYMPMPKEDFLKLLNSGK